jgi:hypothetical protein
VLLAERNPEVGPLEGTQRGSYLNLNTSRRIMKIGDKSIERAIQLVKDLM